MSGSSPLSDKQSTVAGSYYFRQYELKRIYSSSFYRGMAIALAIHAAFVVALILMEPIYNKTPDVETLLPPVTTGFRIIEMKMIGIKESGMDVSGKGGGEGTIKEPPAAAFANVRTSRAANPKASITNNASIVPRSLQGPGINDIAGIRRNPVYFDTLKGFNGSSRNGTGSGGGTGSTVGNTSGEGSGMTDKNGFGGGFGDRFVPGNPANNSATGTPYEISWNGVARSLLNGDAPTFPAGVERGGVVRIRLSVDPAGNIVSIVPVEKADSRLEEAAMTAIRTWKFSKLPHVYPQVDQQATAKFVFKLE